MRAKRRARRYWLATFAIVGLAGAVYAAEEATAPDGGDLEQTINRQRVGAGHMVNPASISEHQLKAFTPDQMMALAAKYREEMKSGADHVEHLRMEAYRSRDLIRMTCVDDKLTQVGVVVHLAEPRAAAIMRETESLQMRAHFSLVQQAKERVVEIVAEAEQCMGENLATVSTGKIREEENPDTIGVADPTRPAATIHEVDRPAEASPYR